MFRLKILIFVFFISLFNGCSGNYIVSPLIENNQNNLQIKGDIIGKKTYLPEVIIPDSTSSIKLDYSIKEEYNISDTSKLIHIFSALITGLQFGENNVLINAQLKITNKKMNTYKYHADCFYSYSGLVSLGPDSTKMRNICLEELSRNISFQIKNDLAKGNLNEFIK